MVLASAFEAQPVEAQAEILRSRIKRILVKEGGIYVEIYGKNVEPLLNFEHDNAKIKNPPVSTKRIIVLFYFILFRNLINWSGRRDLGEALGFPSRESSASATSEAKNALTAFFPARSRYRDSPLVASPIQIPLVFFRKTYVSLNLFLFRKLLNWSGRRDLNPRPPAPHAGALARLRHAPNLRGNKLNCLPWIGQG